MSSIFEVSELARPLGPIANHLKMAEITFLAKAASQYAPLILYCLAHAHHALAQWMIEHLKQNWLSFADFCKLRANALVLNISSVLHMKCIEIIVPLHKSLLVAMLFPNDLCILIMNFVLCV